MRTAVRLARPSADARASPASAHACLCSWRVDPCSSSSAVGYVVGYALAEEHLRQALTVVAESVNPLTVTREAWRDTAVRAGVVAVDVEVVYSDVAEHQRRIASRSVDVPGLSLPGWQQVLEMPYEPWDRERVVIDTAGQRPKESLHLMVRGLVSVAPAPGTSGLDAGWRNT